jgi:hypothetical protein
VQLCHLQVSTVQDAALMCSMRHTLDGKCTATSWRMDGTLNCLNDGGHVRLVACRQQRDRQHLQQCRYLCGCVGVPYLMFSLTEGILRAGKFGSLSSCAFTWKEGTSSEPAVSRPAAGCD